MWYEGAALSSTELRGGNNSKNSGPAEVEYPGRPGILYPLRKTSEDLGILRSQDRGILWKTVEDTGRPRKTPEDPEDPEDPGDAGILWKTPEEPGRPRKTLEYCDPEIAEDRGRPRKTPEDPGIPGIPEYLVGRPSGPAEDRSCFLLASKYNWMANS